MKNTIIRFDLIRLAEKKYLVDPNSLHIFGNINYFHLKELLEGFDYLKEMGVTEFNKPKTITLEVWEDSDDDDENWLDFSFLPDNYQLPTL